MGPHSCSPLATVRRSTQPASFPASATSFLASNLEAGLDCRFRITAFNAAGAAPPVVRGFTIDADPDFGSYAGWFQVRFDDQAFPGDDQPANATSEPFLKLDATDPGAGSLTLVHSEWIHADSAADAVRKAITGAYTNAATSTKFNYPDSGAFTYNPDFSTSDTNSFQAMTVEDRYGRNPSAYNWTDAYIPVAVAEQTIFAFADNSDLVPNSQGTIHIGSFTAAGVDNKPSDFSATITWPDGKTAAAIIGAPDPEYYNQPFLVSVPAIPIGETLNSYTLNVVHLPTGESNSSSV